MRRVVAVLKALLAYFQTLSRTKREYRRCRMQTTLRHSTFTPFMLCPVHDVLGTCGDGGCSVLLIITTSRRCPWVSSKTSPPYHTCECCAGFHRAQPACTTERIKRCTGKRHVHANLGLGRVVQGAWHVFSCYGIDGMHEDERKCIGGGSERRSVECACIPIDDRCLVLAQGCVGVNLNDVRTFS